MKPVPLSLMRDRVLIQSRTVSQDTYGAVVLTWADVTTVWGRVEPISGSESWRAQHVHPDVTHAVTIRYYEGLTPTNRIKVGSRVLNIKSVLDTENRGRQHVLLCIEEV